jgi:hypothetical protein
MCYGAARAVIGQVVEAEPDKLSLIREAQSSHLTNRARQNERSSSRCIERAAATLNSVASCRAGLPRRPIHEIERRAALKDSRGHYHIVIFGTIELFPHTIQVVGLPLADDVVGKLSRTELGEINAGPRADNLSEPPDRLSVKALNALRATKPET